MGTVRTIKNLYAGSIRRQLILGIALVHAILMTIFVFDLVTRQSSFLREQAIEQATSLAQSLAANSTSWVLARDFVGMEEVINSQSSYPSLNYALIHDLNGKVLGYTDRGVVGRYVTDPVSVRLLGHAPETVVLVNDGVLIDVATPILVGERQIGWVRIGLDHQAVSASLNIVTRDGVLYTIAAIVIGTIFAVFMGLGLTRGIYRLMDVADSVRKGTYNARAEVSRADELGKLATGFNEMLDAVDEAKRKSLVDERRVRDFADASSDWLWEMDADLRFTYLSDRYEEITGAKAADTLGKHRWDGVDENEDNEFWAEHRATLLARRPFRDLEFTRVLGDNQRFFVNVSGVPVFSDDGEFTGYRGSAANITERKLLEEQLRRSHRMEAVGQLTGGIAHDFNNLLSVMIGNAEILRDAVGDEKEAQDSIDTIVRTVNRGASLTNRLLSFSRQQALSSRPTSVNRLVEGLEDLLHRTLGEQIKFHVDLGPGGCDAVVDPHQFEDAVINLAINARDAMHTGGVLTIETANTTLDQEFAARNEEVTKGDYVVLAVSDTGAGMPPEVLERVFEPFFTTKDVSHGSGLGLSMVYGFAKQSGGHIAVSSTVGEGTTVRLYMPRSNTPEVPSEEVREAEPEGGRSGRILVVEDDADVRKISANTLISQGYEVVDVENGDAALRNFRAGQTYDLLFTDVVLTGSMSGVEVATVAKEFQPGIKVLYTTGHAESSMEKELARAPVETVIKKPYRRNELLEVVRSILDGTVG